jgi:hypothetical protein
MGRHRCGDRHAADLANTRQRVVFQFVQHAFAAKFRFENHVRLAGVDVSDC